MDPVPIGEAARLLGVNTSALRYYEEIGLIQPYARVGGRRTYGRAELRRLAFIQMAQELGFSLDVIAQIVTQSGERWRRAIDDQATQLEIMIERARLAREFLLHARECPAPNPVQDCETLIQTLDRRLAGATFAEIAADHLDPKGPPFPGNP